VLGSQFLNKSIGWDETGTAKNQKPNNK